MITKNKVFLSFLILGSVFFFATKVRCETANEVFEKAAKQGTIESYIDFLRHYPEDARAGEARQGIEDIIIAQIRNKGTKGRFIIEGISPKVVSGNIFRPIKNGLAAGPLKNGNYATTMTVSSVTQKLGLSSNITYGFKVWEDDPKMKEPPPLKYFEVVWSETGLASENVPKAVLIGKPEENGWRGSTVTIVGRDGPPSNAELWLLEAEYPKDYILLSIQNIAMIPEVEGTVLRFKGEVRFRDYIFKGEKSDPLSFLFHKDGFVYLYGKGELILRDGSMVTFPPNK